MSGGPSPNSKNKDMGDAGLKLQTRDQKFTMQVEYLKEAHQNVKILKQNKLKSITNTTVKNTLANTVCEKIKNIQFIKTKKNSNINANINTNIPITKPNLSIAIPSIVITNCKSNFIDTVVDNIKNEICKMETLISNYTDNLNYVKCQLDGIK
jgi:hypothetical protein